jgi:hypothetical protein
MIWILFKRWRVDVGLGVGSADIACDVVTRVVVVFEARDGESAKEEAAGEEFGHSNFR